MGRVRRIPVEIARAVLVTEQDGSVAHRVTQRQVAALSETPSVRALCGRTFVPAAMTVPDGRRCRRCAEITGRA